MTTPNCNLRKHCPPCRYLYKGESHAFHGGVKVTFKDRLSRVGSNINAEYGPIERVDVPCPATGSGTVKKTVETERGIVFIPYPPDLRREPGIEDWVEDKALGAAKACRKALTVRHQSDLTPEACREWRVLASFHEKYDKAHKVPRMPFTHSVVGDTTTRAYLPPGEATERTFSGTPQALLPVLKELMRFPRPLISWNIFDEEPPSSFPSVGAQIATRQPDATPFP